MEQINMALFDICRGAVIDLGPKAAHDELIKTARAFGVSWSIAHECVFQSAVDSLAESQGHK